MKKRRSGIVAMALVLAVALAFSASYCWAEDEAAAARISAAKKAGGFIAGAIAGLASHELGHEAMARFEGANLRWNGANWSTSASPAALRNIVLSGFGAQVLSAEIMLGVNAIPKDNSFVLGWLAFNIAGSLAYVARDEWQRGYGDIETFRNSGGNADYLKVGLVAHSLFSAYRLYKNPAVMPYAQATKNEIVLGLSWRWN